MPISSCSRRQYKNLDDALMNAILSRSIAINNTTVETESNVKTLKAKGRADIVIDIGVGIPDSTISKLRIVIENKVYSNERNKQTCTYFEYYEKEKQRIQIGPTPTHQGGGFDRNPETYNNRSLGTSMYNLR